MTVDNTISERIKAIFSSVMGIPESTIREDTSHNSLESWDSLNHLKFVSRLEDEFHISFSMDDIIAMDSFAAVKDTVTDYIERSRQD